jgi:6-phosphofructokinase 2
LVTKDSYDYVPAPNVAKKKVLLVLEIVWSVGWYGLWPKIKPLKVLRWGVACGSAMNDTLNYLN